MTIAICPGSFDPITLGHLNIIRRASRIFDKVVVCIMFNSTKTQPMFTIEERVDMVRRAVRRYPNVEVDTFDGLLAESVRKYPGAVIVKGLRAASDFEYEFQQALINKKLYPEFETMFLSCNAHYMYLSSSMVKQIAAQGRDVEEFIPAVIYEDIMKRLYKPLAEG